MWKSLIIYNLEGIQDIQVSKSVTPIKTRNRLITHRPEAIHEGSSPYKQGIEPRVQGMEC